MRGRERPVDRGARVARASIARAGTELRAARLSRGLSLRPIAVALGISVSEASRIELGQSPRVPFLTLARYAAAVGLDLPLRTFPGGDPLRDRAHVELISAFGAQLHHSLRWAVEVPLPTPGDQRAWDGLVSGVGWRYGVEAETAVGDLQALLRRLNLKVRDGVADGVLLIVPATRRTRNAVRAAEPELRTALPVPGRRAMELLAAGVDPGGSALVILPRARGPRSVPPDG